MDGFGVLFDWLLRPQTQNSIETKTRVFHWWYVVESSSSRVLFFSESEEADKMVKEDSRSFAQNSILLDPHLEFITIFSNFLRTNENYNNIIINREWICLFIKGIL